MIFLILSELLFFQKRGSLPTKKIPLQSKENTFKKFYTIQLFLILTKSTNTFIQTFRPHLINKLTFSHSLKTHMKHTTAKHKTFVKHFFYWKLRINQVENNSIQAHQKYSFLSFKLLQSFQNLHNTHQETIFLTKEKSLHQNLSTFLCISFLFVQNANFLDFTYQLKFLEKHICTPKRNDFLISK